MFHYFHDNKFFKISDGSISCDDIYKIVKFIGRKNILNAEDFLFRLKEKKLKNTDLCFTFDDGIKCQYDIALPILEDLKIKSFFFVPSSLLTDKPDFLEIYRFFRTNFFENIDEFYKSFFKLLDKDLDEFYKQNETKINSIKTKSPFYSLSDIKFRLVRDVYLGKKLYSKTMLRMFKEFDFMPEKYFDKLFLSKKDLKNLNSMGHLVGLHSHTHPTKIENLNEEEQLKEYMNNVEILSKTLDLNKSKIKCMSHPSGSYNNLTLNILKNLGIELGFKQVMKIEKEKGMKKINNSNLEIAREDHSTIMKMIN